MRHLDKRNRGIRLGEVKKARFFVNELSEKISIHYYKLKALADQKKGISE
jgi:hypothetical protein